MASDAAKGDLAVNMRDAWQFTRQLAERCKYNRLAGAGCGLDATPVHYCNCSFSHSTTFARYGGAGVNRSQLPIPWAPPSTVNSSQTSPFAFSFSHIAGDWSKGTCSSFVP